MNVKKANLIKCSRETKETDHNHTEYHQKIGDLIPLVHQQLHQSLSKHKLLIKNNLVISSKFGTESAHLNFVLGKRNRQVNGNRKNRNQKFI